MMNGGGEMIDVDKLVIRDRIETIRFFKLVQENVRLIAEHFYREFSIEDIEDVVQEVCERILKKRYEPLRGRSMKEIRNYICKTAYNIMIDILRARKRRAHDDDDDDGEIVDPGPSPDEIVVMKEIKRSILMCIHSLPKTKRLVAILRFLEGKSSGEVAEITGLTRKTVYKYIHQIRERIIEEVKL